MRSKIIQNNRIFPMVTYWLVFTLPAAMCQDARDIIKKADEKLRGETSGQSSMTMEIIRPNWQRSISLKSWSKGTNYSMSLITAPAREKGQAFLKHKDEMWSWNPTINRMIKLPPSMLSQGWMGSDFTNDDLLRESSIVNDFTHNLTGSQTFTDRDCYVIEMLPRELATVVWGKIIVWVSKGDYLQLKAEYYDEEMYLVKTETASDIKNMDGRNIPTRFELVPADKPGHKTLLTITDIRFNVPLQDSFFSQQNMKNLK